MKPLKNGLMMLYGSDIFHCDMSWDESNNSIVLHGFGKEATPVASCKKDYSHVTVILSNGKWVFSRVSPSFSSWIDNLYHGFSDLASRSLIIRDQFGRFSLERNSSYTVSLLKNGQSYITDKLGNKSHNHLFGWMEHYLSYLKSSGIDPKNCLFIMPDGNPAEIIDDVNGYNWIISHES